MGDLSPTPLPTAQLSCRSGITAKKEYALTTGTVGTVQSTKTYTYGDSTWKDLLTDYNGAALSYDTVGNVTGDGTWTYTWQHGRQLSGMSKSGTTASFVYNADGQRISKTVNGTTTQYHYANGKLSHVVKGSEFLHINYDALGPWFVNYDNGTTSTVHYFLRNAQGDILGLVNAHGAIVVSYTYDAWGNVLSTTGSMANTLGALNPFRYRGYVYDTETGLYYLNSRYYNPSWGRFISADVFVSTGQGVLGSNMFAYCGNNPVNKADYNGNIPFRSNVIMVADGGGGAEPQRQTGKKLSTVKTVVTSVTKSVGDAFIGSQIAKALTRVWKSTPPLQVPIKTLANSGPIAGAIKGVSKVAGVFSAIILAIDIYKDVKNYSGWHLVGAIGTDVLGLGITAGVGAAVNYYCTPIIGIPVTIAVGVGTDLGASYVKDNWLKKKES